MKFVEPKSLNHLLWPGLLIGSCLVAYSPTIASLVEGPWQTEQEGHGPLIIAASLWSAWQLYQKWRATPHDDITPAPVIGWLLIVIGLAVMFLGRTQDVLPVETFSIMFVISGCVLLVVGWPGLRAFAFPIFFLLFAVPLPDWLVDGATVPLKVFISDMVTSSLYALGYPVAQNGVIIMIGTYQLLVKDACSGLNSIIALSAIAVFYAYEFRRNERVRSLLLLATIVPITIAANFVRVMCLVLIAYYGDVELIDGTLHSLTGIGLFVVAVILLFLFDFVVGLAILLVRRLFDGLAFASRTIAHDA